MGQTLTHGVYLPDEGERNCYAGLAANWQILDSAVGTIAEHTSALSGKAPLVHTHTKSDVTDLLNSNFIPSANNSYDLGSSSYQWNNLYAKNYYYNGVAWGLDQNNRWTGSNRFDSSIILPAFGSSNYKNYGIATSKGYSGNNNYYKFLRTTGIYGYDDTPDTSKPSFLTFRPHDLKTEIMDSIAACNNGTDDYLAPITNNTTDLGTSTNKWKTLNGINPGALSLPDFSAEFDVSGQIVPPAGENQISINWGKNTFTPSVNGWLSVRIHKATVIKIYRESRASYCFDSRIDSADDICVCSPVVAGVEYTIKIQATQFSSGFDHFRLSPCQGNV